MLHVHRLCVQSFSQIHKQTDDESVLNAVVVPLVDEKEEPVKVVALEDDDSEGEELNIGGTANEPKPKRDDKVRGLQSYAVQKKKGE